MDRWMSRSTPRLLLGNYEVEDYSPSTQNDFLEENADSYSRRRRNSNHGAAQTKKPDKRVYANYYKDLDQEPEEDPNEIHKLFEGTVGQAKPSPWDAVKKNSPTKFQRRDEKAIIFYGIKGSDLDDFLRLRSPKDGINMVKYARRQIMEGFDIYKVRPGGHLMTPEERRLAAYPHYIGVKCILDYYENYYNTYMVIKKQQKHESF